MQLSYRFAKALSLCVANVELHLEVVKGDIPIYERTLPFYHGQMLIQAALSSP